MPKSLSLIGSALAQSQSFNLNQINTALRREIKNTPHKDGKSKQTMSFRDDEITKTNERKQKICEITYSIRIEAKTIRRGGFWVKIDPKSPL